MVTDMVMDTAMDMATATLPRAGIMKILKIQRKVVFFAEIKKPTLEVTSLNLSGLLLITPKIHLDARGYFFESFREDELMKFGFEERFVQENESKSNASVIRGLHMQSPPFAQDKLIRVVRGAIYDVAVDLRTSSPTYGHYCGVYLNGDNRLSLLVPKGFAHGFCCLENDTIVQYRCTDYYNGKSECGVKWNDPDLNIEWPITSAVVSEKDEKLPLLRDFKSPF